MIYDSERIQAFAGVSMPMLDSQCSPRVLIPVTRKLKHMGYEIKPKKKGWDSVIITNNKGSDVIGIGVNRFNALYHAIVSLLDHFEEEKRSKVYQEQLNEPYH